MLSSRSWEDLSLSLQDITPLNQPLIPPVLAHAFAIPLSDNQAAAVTSNCCGQPPVRYQESRTVPSHDMQQHQQQQPSLPPQQQVQTGTYCPMPQAGSFMGPHQPPNGMNSAATGGFPYSQALPQFSLPVQNMHAAMTGSQHSNVGPSPGVYHGFTYGPPGMLPYNMQDPAAMYGFPPFGGFPHPAGMFPGYADYRQPVMMNKDSEQKPAREDYVEETQARALKRPRLVWTPELHKCFVNAVNQIGVDKAVPKVIMQLMNVEGLTRENVASHLQKYRLQLKRQDGTDKSEADPEYVKLDPPSDNKNGQKKKRRRSNSYCEESRGAGSPQDYQTEDFASTESPEVQQQHTCNGTPLSTEQFRDGAIPPGFNDRNTSKPYGNEDDNNGCSEHGGSCGD